MNLTQSLQIITEALNQATTKGAFNMQDVATIVSALQTLSNEVTAIEQKETDAPELKKVK